MWDRFGVLDTPDALQTMLKYHQRDPSSDILVPPKGNNGCYGLYGFGELIKPREIDRLLGRFVTQLDYTNPNPSPIRKVNHTIWDCDGPNPWDWTDNLGLGYWGFMAPNLSELHLIYDRVKNTDAVNTTTPTILPPLRPIPISRSVSMTATVRKDPMDLAGVLWTGFSPAPLTFNGVLRQGVTLSHRPNIIVKRLTIPSGDGLPQKSQRQLQPQQMPLLKISFVSSHTYLSNPLIYPLTIAINNAKTYSKLHGKDPTVHPRDVWMGKIWPLDIPSDPISTTLTQGQKHQSKSSIAPKQELKADEGEETPIQCRDPICVSIRPTIGYSHPHFDPIQPGPKSNPTLGQNYYRKRLDLMDKSCGIAGFDDDQLDLLEPLVDAMTTTLATILIIDLNFNSSPLEELERATLELIIGSGVDGGDRGNMATTEMIDDTPTDETTKTTKTTTTNKKKSNDYITQLLSMPVFVILLSTQGSHLDQEVISRGEIQTRLVTLGFIDIRFTQVITSPTRCINREDQSTEPLLSMLHNGPVGNCEALMSKTDWDSFAKPIHQHISQVLYGEPF